MKDNPIKSIIIIGVPRAGKSTLATAVAKKIGLAGFPVSLVAADVMMDGLQAANKVSFLYSCLYRPAKHLIPALKRRYKTFLGTYLTEMSRITLKQQDAVSVVVYEGCYISPARARKIFDPADFRIVGLGYPNASVADKMAEIRKHDDPNHPTNKLSDNQLNNFVRTMIDAGKNIERECKKFNIPFIDTSFDYNGEINRFADNVFEFLK